MGTPQDIPEKLNRAKQAIEDGETVEETVRTLLGWFDAQRRGFWIVKKIRSALDDLNLVTSPDFEYAYIDEAIRIEERPEETSDSSDEEESSDSSAEPIAAAVVPFSAAGDLTYRVGKLAAANHPPESVTPDTTISEMITIMMANDYSQLPVMTGERSVKGMVSWKSLGSRLAMGQTLVRASDCMEPCHVVTSETSIFDAVPRVVQHEVVLIQDPTNRITGIVTTSDLSLQFGQLGEPFLVLGEIENQIRTLIHKKYTREELESVRDPDDPDREVNDVSDLTFGEYLRLIEKPDRWDKLGIPADRRVFVAHLDRVREIRNDVMHFDPDGIAEDELDALRQFTRFLQQLQAVRGDASPGNGDS